jgi:hypothetical protein
LATVKLVRDGRESAEACTGSITFNFVYGGNTDNGRHDGSTSLYNSGAIIKTPVAAICAIKDVASAPALRAPVCSKTMDCSNMRQ